MNWFQDFPFGNLHSSLWPCKGEPEDEVVMVDLVKTAIRRTNVVFLADQKWKKHDLRLWLDWFFLWNWWNSDPPLFVPEHVITHLWNINTVWAELRFEFLLVLNTVQQETKAGGIRSNLQPAVWIGGESELLLTALLFSDGTHTIPRHLTCARLHQLWKRPLGTSESRG